ncbi:MAG TPA: hypothetical protein ENH92_01460, partial [Ectothiorhodospiraceae bacterium]|nr:hypothetical protein [Ectothiorhodospiraceae bacterium]
MVQRSVLILAILVITGCSGLKRHFQDDQTYINGLLKNEEYELALRHIDRQDKKDPNYHQLQQQRPLILEKIQRYELRTLTQSQKLVKSQKWSDSIELLEKAVGHIPASKKLFRELKKQRNRRDEEVAQLRYQITIHE